jgi:hypothetical protein
MKTYVIVLVAVNSVLDFIYDLPNQLSTGWDQLMERYSRPFCMYYVM